MMISQKAQKEISIHPLSRHKFPLLVLGEWYGFDPTRLDTDYGRQQTVDVEFSVEISVKSMRPKSGFEKFLSVCMWLSLRGPKSCTNYSRTNSIKFSLNNNNLSINPSINTIYSIRDVLYAVLIILSSKKTVY